MSLVEKALQKMQAQAKAQGAATAAPKAVGRVIHPEPATAIAVEPPASTTSTRNVLPPQPARVITLNRATLRHQGMLPPEHEERAIAQQYRQIKRPLVTNAFGRGAPALPNGRLIMVASALPGDGKTFTSMNLALSISREEDVNVVLVDADVAKRHLSMILGLGEEPGLLDALRDPDQDMERFILPTDVPSLSLLSAGRRVDNATELLSSNRMEDVSRQLVMRDPNRIVVFDSPPLMLTTESQALARAVGQIVVVVRAGVTPQGVLLDALSTLGERPVSLLLNQSVARSATNYYYGYGDSREGSSP